MTTTLPTLPLELCLKILYEYKGLSTPSAILIKKMNKTTPSARLIKKFIKIKDDKIFSLKIEKLSGLKPYFEKDERGVYMELLQNKDGAVFDFGWHTDYIWELENDHWSYPSLNDCDYDPENAFFKFVKKIH